ncbi:MAG TPA: PAS domain S-box protein [Thermoanaerobaculia bacterium]|jgi:PAS domain S-box-containing protein|nr:PAS domain S-box protein [Thermoanaerobaculia bacterium]
MKPLNILIVDDQPINLRLLRAELEAEGHTVFEASNGEEGVAVLDRQQIDVIISDILMPVMDGYRFCHEVRRSERHRDIPFIVYTSTYLSPSDEKLSLDLGADRYLRKPASLGDINRSIEDVLAAPRREPTVVFDSTDVLKEYNAGLVAKLEKKNIDLSNALDLLTLQTTALETAADGMLITDAAGVILWVNPAFTTATGYTADEAIGQTPRILRSGLQNEEFYRAFWKTILSGRTFRGEFINRRKDGTISYDEHTVTPVHAADGTITNFVGVLHDVTERRRVEEELRAANAQVRQFLDHSPAVLYALGIEGERIVPRFASENIGRLLGFSASEAMRVEFWTEQLHPDDVQRASRRAREAIEHGSSRTEYRLRHANGSYRWVEDNQRLVRDESGRPVELVGVATDITDRKRAEDELHDTERRFREMLDNLDLISIMLDEEDRLVYCNDYFLRLTGWTREEAIGVDWFDSFLPPEMRDEMRGLYSLLLSERKYTRHYTNEIITRSGARRLIQWNNSLLYSAAGEVVGVASIAEDITDRIQLEKQLFRAQRLESLGTLAGGIAHDLNNLLLPILMGVTLLKRFGPNEASLQAIDNIERSVKRGSELVKQVLLFARGGQTSRESVRLGDVVREIQAIITSTFPKDITLETAVAKDVHPVTGDATQLTQVLLNLCVNARDAMPHGGHIFISARNHVLSDTEALLHGAVEGSAYAILEVADTGEGMSKEMIDLIFDPFYTTKEVGSGTGLGLSTVQGIVSNHGGFITVSSTVGEGSTFTVHLPARGVRPEAAVAAADISPLPQGHGEVILLVDDDASVLSITKQTLEEFGYEVLAAEDGAQAIGIFSRRHDDIALVLTDMAMPVIDGFALIAALNRIGRDVRVIAATGNPAAASMTKIARSGVTNILVKPYTADHLLRTIAAALAEPAPPQTGRRQ